MSPVRLVIFCNSDHRLNFFPPTTAGRLLRHVACHPVLSHTYFPLPPRTTRQRPLTSLPPVTFSVGGLPALSQATDRPSTSSTTDYFFVILPCPHLHHLLPRLPNPLSATLTATNCSTELLAGEQNHLAPITIEPPHPQLRIPSENSSVPEHPSTSLERSQVFPSLPKPPTPHCAT